MKTFIELFTAARNVGTPAVAVRTFDATSTIANVQKSLGDEAKSTPFISWDSIHGLRGLGEKDNEGSKALATMATTAGVEVGATVDLALALGLLEFAPENVIVFIHNPHLIWSTDPKVIQGIWNLRDGYKANGNMIVLLYGAGDDLPVELQQDILVLDEPLPTRDDLAKIIVDTYADAAKDGKKACKNPPSAAVLKAGTDALVGLPSFPAESAVAMSLDTETGNLDIEQLWTRKRSIIAQMPGLSFHQGTETLADVYGCESIKKFGISFMEGQFGATTILRTDEIEKQFAGNGTDSSGSTGKLLGEFLSWIEDKKVICSLFLGVPGSSKSWFTYCIGGHYHKPVINFNIAAMEDKHVGEGNRHLRNAERTVESISDGRIWLIATANSLRGLPPELISRFQVGGIFFFDAPNEEEREGIMKLKVTKYGLADQPFPDMEGWTGRDIENCARKAQLLNCSLIDAGKYVVPLMKSHHEDMDTLRQSAHDRFLSASHSGVYQYTAPPTKTTVHTPTVVNGRKFR